MHWIREKPPSIAAAIRRTARVLAMPGGPSIRRCPPVRRPISRPSMRRSCPTSTRDRLARSVANRARASVASCNSMPDPPRPPSAPADALPSPQGGSKVKFPFRAPGRRTARARSGWLAETDRGVIFGPGPGEARMIELAFTVCLLASPDVCEQRSLLYVDLSVGRCISYAPPQLAKWTSEHEEWRVTRWTCRLHSDGARGRLTSPRAPPPERLRGPRPRPPGVGRLRKAASRSAPASRTHR